MQRPQIAAGVLALLIAAAAPSHAGELRLLMLDQVACEWCEQWEEEIGVVYHKTTEGRQAPLLRHSIHDDLPEGIEIARVANFTPTFVLLEDGREIGRIAGYPGADFFYPMLQRLLDRAGQAETPSQAPGAGQ